MDATVSVYSQIASCTSSDSDYTLNCENIFKELGNNSKTYIKNFLTSISTILSDDSYPPIQQFLALQLLAQATETNNKELIKQVATSKEFLNRLFHDAQFDYEEPLDQKGKFYFHDSPDNELMKLGKDYIRLVLEAFTYWSKEYGTPNSHDPLHCFYAVYTSLCGKTQLPTTYKFITKNPQVRRYVQKQGRAASSSPRVSNRSRSQSPTSIIIGHDVSRDDSFTTVKAESSEAYGQLLNCVASEEHYEKNSGEIFELVERPSLDYNKQLLKAITRLMKGAKYSWSYKFYTLYLLAQITQTKDKVFVTQLVREAALLNELYRQAKKKGKCDVKETAKESDYKKDVHALTLETIKFWHLHFGTRDINSPFYAFTYLYNTLKKVVDFPRESQFEFIKSKADRKKHHSVKFETETREPLRKSTRTATTTSLATSTATASQEYSSDNDPIMRLVKTYISSGIAFRDDSSNIAPILIKQPKNRSDNYLQGTYRLLNSIEIRPSQKFYALYLLLIIAETKNNTFISALAESKSLLDLLLKEALFDKNEPAGKRGSRFFGNRPGSEESVIGSNYVQLAGEIIRFLGRNHGVDNSRHPNHVFITMAEKLGKSVSLDQNDYYVSRDLKAIDDSAMKRFEVTPFHGHMSSSSPLSSSPLSRSREDRFGKASLTLSDLEKSLKDLNYSKTVLLMFLQDNERKNYDNVDMVDNMVHDITNCYKTKVHPHLEHLMNSSGHGPHEDYKTVIYQEGKTANDLEQLLIHYKTSKTSFFELRDHMIALLGNTPTPQTPTSTRLNRPSFLDNRPPMLDNSGMHISLVGRLQQSDPGAFTGNSGSPTSTRSPTKARTEVIRPMAVSDGASDFLSRHEALLGRSPKRAGTAIIPAGKPSFGGSLRSFDNFDIPVTESVSAVHERRPVESMRAIEPFEKLGLAIDEKIKAVEQMRLSRGSISLPSTQDNKRNSVMETGYLTNYLSQNKTSLSNSSYLFPENNRSSYYGKPLSVSGVPQLETSMYVPPSRSLYEVDHGARPLGTSGISGVRRFEGVGVGTSVTPSYMHSKLGANTLSVKGDSPVGRGYLFSSSVFGNRQNM